jgi:hypothetical protein
VKFNSLEIGPEHYLIKCDQENELDFSEEICLEKTLFELTSNKISIYVSHFGFQNYF